MSLSSQINQASRLISDVKCILDQAISKVDDELIITYHSHWQEVGFSIHGPNCCYISVRIVGNRLQILGEPSPSEIELVSKINGHLSKLVVLAKVSCK